MNAGATDLLLAHNPEISDPRLGIGCLGKVNTVYDNDMELMIKFYQFVTRQGFLITSIFLLNVLKFI